METFFDEIGQDQSAEHGKPFFAIEHENDKDLTEWFSRTINDLKRDNEPRHSKVKNNYARYKGIQYRDQVYTPRDLPEKKTRFMPQMVVPLISDMVDEKVARLLEYKPSVVAIPNNDEQQDKIAAKTAKKFLSHVDQAENLDYKFQRAVRSAKIAGESFVFSLWDIDKGREILPAGKTIISSSGQEIKGPYFEGDVSIENETTLNVLYEKAKCWDKVNYIFRFKYRYTEELKRDYPESAEKIKSVSSTLGYDYENMEVKSLDGMSLVVEFFHKRTKYLHRGFEACFVGDVILKKGHLSYAHGLLPVTRFIDVENEEELSGESSLDKTKAIASQYNNLLNTAIKQINLCAHPKWAVDASSVSDQDLGNDTGIIHLKPGSRQPTLIQSNPVSPQVFDFAEKMKGEFREMSKSNSIVRGEPPPGVTAFVALQFVSEAENRRLSSDMANTNMAIKDVYDKTLKVCAQRYKKDDKRTMMIIGKDNRWSFAFLDPQDLARPFTLLLQNSSALPESKALRTQFVLDMGKTFPEQFPPSQIAEMLDLGQNEKMMDIAGGAARCAEDENEMILDGQMIPDPEVQEDLITHWMVHVSAIQDVGFKMKTDDDIQEAMKDHIMATEMLMMEQASKSRMFGQLVSQRCPQFPLFFSPPAPPPMPMPMPIGGEIPGGPAPVGTLEEAPSVGLMPGDPGFSGVKGPKEQMRKSLDIPIR